MSGRIATPRRGARAASAAALILALSATVPGGSAVASPSDTEGCSVLAHERNDGVQRVHEAWQGFRQQLQELAREARQVQREARGSEAVAALTADAREELSEARQELDAIWTRAHEELQGLVELGTACKEPAATAAEDPQVTLASVTGWDEGTRTVTLWVQFNESVTCDGACKTLFSYTANGDAEAVTAETWKLDEDGMGATLTFTLDATTDVDGSSDELSFSAGAGASLRDGDSNAMASESEEPVDLSLQTNDLVKKYREVVDQAIKDLQAVVDGVSTMVEEMLAAAETEDTTDDAKVTDNRGTGRERGKPEAAGDRGKDHRR